MKRGPQANERAEERALVCGVLLPGHEEECEGALTEVRGLVVAAGGVVSGAGFVQRRQRAVPATLMGSGKIEEIKAEIERSRPDLVVVDNDLSPAQGRNLEQAFGTRVVDRSELILDIFARRAQTHQARLQVELAQVEYLLPRLKRMWTHLERQVGGIGTRGPGETQLESDRRLLDRRVRDLKKELAGIEQRRRVQVRTRHEHFTAGLIGYTNAGKSTLLNRLTGSNEYAADQLFATLDTRTRKWRLSDGRLVLLSDTVGFLRRLPHHLVASFHATLEEALNVDLLLHVVDASHPDARAQMAAVDSVLKGLSRALAPCLLVFNKVDAIADPIGLAPLRDGRLEEVVFVSARTNEGVDRLEAAVARRLDARSVLAEVTLPLADGRTAAALRGRGVVESEECLDGVGLRLRVRMLESALFSLERACGKGVRIDVVQPALEPLVAGDPAVGGQASSDDAESG